MINVYITDSILGKQKQIFRKAVVQATSEIGVKERYETAIKNISILQEWAIDEMTARGYKVTETDLKHQLADYGSSEGHACFLETEKYDSLKGFFALVIEKNKKLEEENETLKRENVELQIIKEKVPEDYHDFCLKAVETTKENIRLRTEVEETKKELNEVRQALYEKEKLEEDE